jgi:hypothetical protein
MNAFLVTPWSFAPSGFMGEMGAPRTVTVGAGVRF